MAERYPSQDSSVAQIEEPFRLLQLENPYYPPPPPPLSHHPLPHHSQDFLPQHPLQPNQLNVGGNGGGANFNRVPYCSNIKNVIENQMHLPMVSMEMLSLLNVVDQWYYGTSVYDNGVWLAVAFTKNVNSAFRETLRKQVSILKLC